MPSKGFFSKAPQQRPRDFREAWSQLSRHLDFLDLESHVDLTESSPWDKTPLTCLLAR